MIASLLVTLDECGTNFDDTVLSIRQLPCVEVGELPRGTNRLPLTIDSPEPESLEETTCLLLETKGVAFVDVVFVHFEEEDDHPIDK